MGCCTSRLVGVFSLDLCAGAGQRWMLIKDVRARCAQTATTRSVTQRRADRRGGGTHGGRGGLLVAGLASDLEGDAIGGGVLELKGGGGQVVEVLVEKLQSRRGVLASANRPRSRPLPSRNAELRSSLGPWSSATRKQRARDSRIVGPRTSFADLAMSEKAGTDMMGGCGGRNTEARG